MNVSPSRVTLLAAGLVASLLASGALIDGQSARPVVVIESPPDGGYVSGRVPIKVRIEPAGTVVRSVSVSADGRLVCTFEQPPYECQWDAGRKVVEHTIRASALLGDGGRIARTVRTKDAGYIETVNVAAVQLTVSVTDGKGRFVRGLPREAFRVYEDDVPQKITSFLAENIPLEITVAVDVSGSMGPSMPVVKQSVRKFLSALRPADSVTLLGFNDNVFTLARPSADLPTRLKALDRLAPWGGTALYDVVVRALDQLGREAGRRTLVVFTDGEDLNSRVPAETAEHRLEASDAVLYAIGQGRAPKLEALRRVLERLAQKSGGRAFFEDLDGLDEVFEHIIEELSNQYLIGYARPDTHKDGRWRTIRVELPNRDVKVRTRQGYRVIE